MHKTQHYNKYCKMSCTLFSTSSLMNSTLQNDLNTGCEREKKDNMECATRLSSFVRLQNGTPITFQYDWELGLI